MARRKTVPMGLRATIYDFSDRAFLANIHDATGADGWATTTDIARACGFTGNSKKGHTPAIKVASRLVAMRRGELLISTGPDLDLPYKEPGDRDTRWRLTEKGERIRQGSVSRAVTNAVDRMDEGALVEMMHLVAERGWVQGDVAEAFAVRREFQHVEHKRRLVFK